MSTQELLDDALSRATGVYSLGDASAIIRVPLGKLRRWAAGYWYSDGEEDHFSGPVVDGDTDYLDQRLISFPELMELFVVGFFRSNGVSMPVVRASRARAQELFEVEFPFATENLQTDGKGVFAELREVQLEGVQHERLLIELSKGQIAFDELVRPMFRDKLDFERGLAFRYWPLGRARPIVLDARRSFGKSIVASRSTPTAVLYNMAEAGESIERIARWYKLSKSDVEAAYEYEQSLRSAA
jgi:uncharacterized protein (DUF433 family)